MIPIHCRIWNLRGDHMTSAILEADVTASLDEVAITLTCDNPKWDETIWISRMNAGMLAGLLLAAAQDE